MRRFDPDVVVMEACCDYTQATDQVYIDPQGHEVLPATDAVAPDHLAVPMGPSLTERQVAEVVATARAARAAEAR